MDHFRESEIRSPNSSPFHWHGPIEHINYLRAIAVIGWMAMASIVLVNLFKDETHQEINGLVILLIVLINFYGLIVINNSKEDYIRRKFEDMMNDGLIEFEAGEISTLIGSALSLDKVPNYAENAVETPLIHLMLPFNVTYDGVVKIFGGEPIHNHQAVLDTIYVCNQRIIEALEMASEEGDYNLNWGVTEPPLGRMMCEPTVAYKKAMINFHKDLNSELATIW